MKTMKKQLERNKNWYKIQIKIQRSNLSEAYNKGGHEGIYE